MIKYAQRPAHVIDASFWIKESSIRKLDFKPLGRFWIRKTTGGYETVFFNCYGCIHPNRAMPLVSKHLYIVNRVSDARRQVRCFIEDCKQYWR